MRPRPRGQARLLAAAISPLSNAHDFDELACPEVAKWRALGEVLLGFDAAPHSFDTAPIIATSREKPGSGAQSWGAMPATQIMATMLKVMEMGSG